MTMRSIIIDDEQSGRDTLESLLDLFCPNVEIVAVADSVKNGIDAIHKHQPDLLFLDIEMPHATGFDLLDALSDKPFEVIITTAYDQYAIKAIKHSAVDYLLKPIDRRDLMAAVEKAERNVRETQAAQTVSAGAASRAVRHRIALPTEDGLTFIKVSEIVRCESNGNYTDIFDTTGKKTLVARSLKEYDELLSGTNFCRVHKSHLINLNMVKKYVRGEGGYLVLLNGDEIPVSRRKKEELLKLLNA